MKPSAYFRERAAEVRREAKAARVEDIRSQFLFIATQYDGLAEMIEERARHRPGASPSPAPLSPLA